MLFRSGANQNQTARIAINKVNPDGLGVGTTNNQFNSLDEIDVTSASKAQDTSISLRLLNWLLVTPTPRPSGLTLLMAILAV